MTADKFIPVAEDYEPSREGLKLLGRRGYAAETAVASRTDGGLTEEPPRWSRALVRTLSHGRRHDHRTRTWSDEVPGVRGRDGAGRNRASGRPNHDAL